jgi:serine/threonine protein kinase
LDIMASPVNADELLELVRKSNLIPPDKLAGSLSEDGVPGTAPPSELADRLVRMGLLTRFQVGQLLRGKHRGFELGKYRILEPIADGGMGRVFLCQHLRMGHRVAVKLLYPEAIQRDPLALARFQREARAAAQLNHPNVVRTHDIDQSHGHHFLVMDYVEGTTLYDLVRRSGQLPVAEAVGYVMQVGLGLQHIHENCLVHRDLKPSNLLLDLSGTVKILDLGLALFRDDRRDYLTRKQDSNAILGTADFLAPEQALSSDVDIRADIYSLGCVLYFLLTARLPFGDMPLTRKLLSLHMAVPTPILDHRPDLNPALVEVVNRMMAKNADDRYRTPAEAVDALAPFAPAEATLPPRAPGSSAPVTTRKEPSAKRDASTASRAPRPPGSTATALPAAAPTPKATLPAAKPSAGKLAARPKPKAAPRKTPRPPRRRPLLYGALIGGAALVVITAAVIFLTRATTPASEIPPLPEVPGSAPGSR